MRGGDSPVVNLMPSFLEVQVPQPLSKPKLTGANSQGWDLGVL